MSKITQAIKERMHDFTCDSAGKIEARFNFTADFVGFKGHFPGKPVLPGICKIQAIMCMLESAASKTPRLKEIISAKFFAPVTCDEEIIFTVRQSPANSEETRISAQVTDVDKKKKISEIQLRVVFE